MKLVYVMSRAGQLVGPLKSADWHLSEERWRELLSLEQFRLLRQRGMEAAFCGLLLENNQEGIYFCAGCSLPLFSSAAKFDSGTGWLSFFQPLALENLSQQLQDSQGMQRVEIRCARCDGHLGHVFPDGPPAGQQRYALNSGSLIFAPSNQLARLADPAAE